MQRAIGSKVHITDEHNELAVDYYNTINDLMEFDEVKELDNFHQHINTSRLQHCINVSYYSYRIAKLIGANPRLSARAGLLHDLFWYDWRTTKTPQLHAFYHPKEALLNAKALVELDVREEDAILKHMWPLYFGIPKYKESIAVTLADKYCATMEIFYQWGHICVLKMSTIFNG